MDIISPRRLINKISYYRFTRLFAVYLFVLLFSLSSPDTQSATSGDSHYSSVGFFDIHVCNWPDRPLFFLAVFSTYNFNDISNTCNDCIVYILKEKANVLSKKELHEIIIKRGLLKKIDTGSQACVLKA